jgi:methylated-DNA-[protein]-cysteine S-methyltransferase
VNELESLLQKPPEAAPDDAVRRAVERAAGAGVVDVGYASHDSPVGRLLLAATRRGLVTIAFPQRGEDAVVSELARRISPRVVELPRRLDAIRRELDEYFAGTRTSFEHPVDWSYVAGFSRRVLRATTRIPYGRVETYRSVAAAAGSAKAVRAAGNALGANRVPIVVPCHRVIRTGGGLGGYTGGLEVKSFLLELEGVA